MRKRIILSIVMVVFLVLSVVPGAFAAERMDTRMIAQINKPGVIFVYSRWTATMVWNEWAVDDSLYTDINDVMNYYWENGEVDDSTWWPTYISLFINNMYDYAYYTGAVHNTNGWIGGSGTGFIITPDGYMITNAHVVEMSEKELVETFTSANLQSEAAKHVNSFADAWNRAYGYTMSDSEREDMFYAVYDIYSQTMEISDTSHTHTAYIGNVSPGADISTKGIQIDIRKVGIPSSSKDVAILKLDGTNFPTVALGDDKELKTGDPIYVMGYPGIATTSGVVDQPTAMQEPTMTQGILSAKQIWNDGGNILQYDAATFGGNSGGPVFNEYGEVIGIHTFGLNDKGQRVAGYAYSVPISTLKVYLNELNITPSESKFTSDFRTALNAYNDGDYATALELLRGINETNPGFPVIQELLADARTAYDKNPSGSSNKTDPIIDTPTDTTNKSSSSGSNMSTLTLILIILGVVVVIAVVIIIIVASSKKKSKQAVAPQNAQPAFNQPPQYQQLPPQPQYQQIPPGPTYQQIPQQTGYPQPPVTQTQYQPAPPPAPQPVPPPLMEQTQYIPPVVTPIPEQTVPQVAFATCPRCNAPLAPDARFCDACGFSIQTIEVIPSNQCPQCGSVLAPGAKFCNTCGFRLE